MFGPKMKNALLISLFATTVASAGLAQETTYTLLGTPGLIEMPSARSAPDAEVAANISYWRLQQKSNFTFQVTPRLTGTFRYSGISERGGPGTDGTFDRSFDLKYRIIDEGTYVPAVAIGLQDFLGTGLLSGEYIVATKAVTPSIDVTAGIGWGRLGTNDPFGTPFGERPARDFGKGGEIEANQFFKGDAAFFGGIDYRVSEKLSFQAEYSSDAYDRETRNGSLAVNAPVNIGVTYRPRPGIALNAAYLYGSEFAGGLTVYLNPKSREAPSGLETAPLPIYPSTSPAAASWDLPNDDSLRAVLAADGIRLLGTDISGSTARIRYTNTKYRSEAQAMGRAARILTGQLPASITTFVMEPARNGVVLSATTLDRATLENLENRADAASMLQVASVTAEAGTNIGLSSVPPAEPRFKWGIAPYLAVVVFNGDAPIQADVGLDFTGQYEIRPNLLLSGSIRQSALGEREIADIFENPNDYPNVRTDSRFYGVDGKPVLSNLTLTHYSRLGSNLYGRASVGYFESMYGGAAAEVLWKPVDSRLAVGAEVVYAVQRDYDMGLGFRDFDTVTTHASVYYDFENGFHGQIDVGQYLAGDKGATFTLNREFDNGWKVGGYFSLTDMSFDDFGEGSFDKGIRISVPTDFFLGKPTRRTVDTNLSSLTRDGGARVSMDGRLYDTVEAGHIAGGLGDTWGRFWR